MQNII